MGIESSMNALLVIIADAMPEEQLVDHLQEGIDHYKETVVLNKSEEERDKAFQGLTVTCMLILQKSTKRSVEDSIKQFEEAAQVHHLLKKENQ